ncbi:MAG: HPF/RaiA family ribosome-associated protein [Calditrichaeota bacterium]|nr:HPF/RaiA family ribosome-associated protein [Calditrichota bacterium]
MQVHVRTDHNIEGREDLIRYVQSKVADELRHFADQISRVEVHLGDENSGKPGTNDMRCMMEARLEGLKPVAVTHNAASLHMAIDGAGEKLVRVIESTLGKLRDKKKGGTEKGMRSEV